MVKFKQYTFLRCYWDENKWLEFYFGSYPSFAGWCGKVLKNYDIKPKCELVGLKEVVYKTRRQIKKV